MFNFSKSFFLGKLDFYSYDTLFNFKAGTVFVKKFFSKQA